MRKRWYIAPWLKTTLGWGAVITWVAIWFTLALVNETIGPHGDRSSPTWMIWVLFGPLLLVVALVTLAGLIVALDHIRKTLRQQGSIRRITVPITDDLRRIHK